MEVGLFLDCPLYEGFSIFGLSFVLRFFLFLDHTLYRGFPFLSLNLCAGLSIFGLSFVQRISSFLSVVWRFVPFWTVLCMEDCLLLDCPLCGGFLFLSFLWRLSDAGLSLSFLMWACRWAQLLFIVLPYCLSRVLV